MSDPDKTPTEPLSKSDRLIIEDQLDELKSLINNHIERRNIEAQTFYDQRMTPLEVSSAMHGRWIFAVGGLALAALIVAVLCLGTVLLLHG